jgi:cold shock CspA family protein
MPRDRLTGEVRYWHRERGYGFVSCRGESDIFVHIRQCRHYQPEVGDRVSFLIEPGERDGQWRAVDVRHMA